MEQMMSCLSLTPTPSTEALFNISNMDYQEEIELLDDTEEDDKEHMMSCLNITYSDSPESEDDDAEIVVVEKRMAPSQSIQNILKAHKMSRMDFEDELEDNVSSYL